MVFVQIGHCNIFYHMMTKTNVFIKVCIFACVEVKIENIASLWFSATPKLHSISMGFAWKTLSKINSPFESSHSFINTELTGWSIYIHTCTTLFLSPWTASLRWKYLWMDSNRVLPMTSDTCFTFRRGSDDQYILYSASWWMPNIISMYKYLWMSSTVTGVHFGSALFLWRSLAYLLVSSTILLISSGGGK